MILVHANGYREEIPGLTIWEARAIVRAMVADGMEPCRFERARDLKPLDTRAPSV